MHVYNEKYKDRLDQIIWEIKTKLYICIYTFDKDDYQLEFVTSKEVAYGSGDSCSINCTLTCKVSWLQPFMHCVC